MPVHPLRKLYKGGGEGPNDQPVLGYHRNRGKLRAPELGNKVTNMCCRCKYNTNRCRAFMKTKPGQRCNYCAVKGNGVDTRFCLIHQDPISRAPGLANITDESNRSDSASASASRSTGNNSRYSLGGGNSPLGSTRSSKSRSTKSSTSSSKSSNPLGSLSLNSASKSALAKKKTSSKKAPASTRSGSTSRSKSPGLSALLNASNSRRGLGGSRYPAGHNPAASSSKQPRARTPSKSKSASPVSLGFVPSPLYSKSKKSRATGSRMLSGLIPSKGFQENSLFYSAPGKRATRTSTKNKPASKSKTTSKK